MAHGDVLDFVVVEELTQLADRHIAPPFEKVAWARTVDRRRGERS
jgi:hypothetical protein